MRLPALTRTYTHTHTHRLTYTHTHTDTHARTHECTHTHERTNERPHPLYHFHLPPQPPQVRLLGPFQVTLREPLVLTWQLLRISGGPSVSLTLTRDHSEPGGEQQLQHQAVVLEDEAVYYEVCQRAVYYGVGQKGGG